MKEKLPSEVVEASSLEACFKKRLDCPLSGMVTYKVPSNSVHLYNNSQHSQPAAGSFSESRQAPELQSRDPGDAATVISARMGCRSLFFPSTVITSNGSSSYDQNRALNFQYLVSIHSYNGAEQRGHMVPFLRPFDEQIEDHLYVPCLTFSDWLPHPPGHHKGELCWEGRGSLHSYLHGWQLWQLPAEERGKGRKEKIKKEGGRREKERKKGGREDRERKEDKKKRKMKERREEKERKKERKREGGKRERKGAKKEKIKKEGGRREKERKEEGGRIERERKKRKKEK
ncbi:Chromatin assembly factor 1 subunit A, partial [Ophiophagus hannah]